MAGQKIASEKAGIPVFDLPENGGAGDVFSLSSHQRAREALAFGLAVADTGYNIFVLGEDRAGRMTATMEFLEKAMANRPPPDDWIYLNNFRHSHRPRPYRLPAGQARRFREKMEAAIRRIRQVMVSAFSSDEYRAAVELARQQAMSEMQERAAGLRERAAAQGLAVIVRAEGGISLGPLEEDAGKSRSLATVEKAAALASEVSALNQWGAERQAVLNEWINDYDREIADRALDGLLQDLVTTYGRYPGLARWLTELRVDMLENLDELRRPPRDDDTISLAVGPDNQVKKPEIRYGVNVLVDHIESGHADVVLEANPIYENLFGRIEYRQVSGILETDFSLIAAGALHRANGGVLVLRADALMKDQQAWSFLKAALRDGHIAIEELYRQRTTPIAAAPQPEPIPLDLKVVVVGTPAHYYSFFNNDPEFQAYFKVKAEIDADMEANAENLSTYQRLLGHLSHAHDGATCDGSATQRLLGMASRWAADRTKLTARFELMEDLLAEAAEVAGNGARRIITETAVKTALAQRRRRNARGEDRLQENIRRGIVLIDTDGAVVGQINSLSVRDSGEYAYGAPSRVTARCSVGRRGVANIERDVSLSGPLQQKGVMVLQGFLSGHFARNYPLSFNCSLTFEQLYGGVEGDSGTLAEILAILSDLSGVPLRQDLAVTGSMNQRGEVQSVGGVHRKVEGFFRTCVEKGGLTGNQGVVVPAANEDSLVLDDPVVRAMEEGRFHLWSVTTVDEAIELFTGIPAGVMGDDGLYPPETIYGRVVHQLEAFDRILLQREGRFRD